MSTAISPQITSKIIDLSGYTAAVPSTISFMAALCKKGEDNKLRFVGSRSELISEWGEPNITDYGKNYGQGLYFAYEFLGESGSLYFIRALPSDAAYSNLRIDAVRQSSDATANIQITYVADINSATELETSITESGDTYPLGVLYPIGRGDYYNGISVRFTEMANPVINDMYILDIYERQSDGDDVIIESFNVSFNPNAKDDTGDSVWITYVLNQYSSVLRFGQMIGENYSSGYNMIYRIYGKNRGSVALVSTDGSATLTDNKQDFSNFIRESGDDADYIIIVKDGRGRKIWGWINTATGDNNETCTVHSDRLNVASAEQTWQGATSTFDFDDENITYLIKKDISSVSDAFLSSDPAPLKKGSDGSLLDSQGDLDDTIASQVLSQAYSGIIDDSILDSENIYFNLIYECGYPYAVKSSAVTTALTRRDCVTISDVEDNASFSATIDSRNNTYSYNTYLVALYEGYNKIYDPFTGKDIWVSPNFHMAYLLPRNDNVTNIWWAAAGLQRGAIQTISELRYNPRLGQRDQLYLNQINPIVKFNEGYTVWGNLTSQAKPSAMQDLNIVRLVLYIKRAFEQFCRYYIFELNDEITWTAVQGEMTSFLEQIKKERGLYSYNVKVYSTEYLKKRKTFKADITIQPTRVVEKIELNFFIQ